MIDLQHVITAVESIPQLLAEQLLALPDLLTGEDWVVNLAAMKSDSGLLAKQLVALLDQLAGED